MREVPRGAFCAQLAMPELLQFINCFDERMPHTRLSFDATIVISLNRM